MENFFKRFGITLLLFLCTQVTFASPESNPPQLIEGDIITFSGGGISSTNPDIYVYNFDVKEGELGGTFKVYLNRPEGAIANYPVKLTALLDTEPFSNGSTSVKMDNAQMEEITFSPGETTKEITITVEGRAVDLCVAFISFSYESRTKTAQSLIQLNIGNEEPFAMDPSMACETSEVKFKTIAPHAVGQYLVFANQFSGYIKSEEDQYLKFQEQQSDFNSKNTSLTPCNTGKVLNTSLYLHKIAEEAVIPGYTNENEKLVPAYVFSGLTIENLKDAYTEYIFDGEYDGSVPEYILLSDTFYAPPRFGELQVSAPVYAGYSEGEIKTRIQNLQFYAQANHTTEEQALKNIKLSVFDNTYNWSAYDAQTNELTFKFDVPANMSGKDSTVFAEIMVWTEDKTHAEYIYPYGAYASFTVSTELANYTFIDQIEVTGLPESNFIFKEGTWLYSTYPQYQLKANITPENATLRGIWSTSDPGVLKIDKEGLLTVVGAGIATITFTSDEVGRREEQMLESRDDVLIKTYQIIVSDQLFPKLTTEPQEHSYEEEFITIKYNHNLMGFPSGSLGWDFNIEAIIYDSSDKEVKRETLDRNLRLDTLNYRLFFDDELLPKKYSKLNAEKEYDPVYKVILSIDMECLEGGSLSLTKEYPVYIMFPAKPEIRMIGSTIPTFYTAGVKDTLSYEVNRLDKKGNYSIEYRVTAFKANTVNDLGVVTDWSSSLITSEKKDLEYGWQPESGGLPEWLKIALTPEGLSHTGIMTVAYAPAEPETEYDYTEVLVTVKNKIPGLETTYSQTTRKKRKDEGVLTKRFKAPDSNEFKDNWDETKIQSSELASKMLGDPYNSDELYSYIKNYWPSRIVSLSYPSSWGKTTMELSNTDSVIYRHLLNNISTFRIDYPLTGGEYIINLKWEQVDPIQYRYSFENLQHKLYVYHISGYNTTKELSLEYTNGKDQQVTKKVICEDGYLCIYEPDTIKGSLVIRGVEKGIQNRNVYATISNVKPLSSGSFLKLSSAFDELTNTHYDLTVQPDFQIRLLDQSGKRITTKATINYVTLDGNTVKSEASYTNSDGYFAVPFDENHSIFNNSSYTQYVEILADGYLPQLLKSKKSDRYNVSIVLKGKERADKHVDAQLNQGGQKISLLNNSIESTMSYSDYEKDALLNVSLCLTDGAGKYTKDDFELKGDNVSAIKPKSCLFISNDVFMYDYAEITYDINGFVKEQSTSSIYMAKGSTILTRLPKLNNTATAPNELSNTLNPALALPMSTNGTSVDDLGEAGKEAGGDFKKPFQNFDLTMPSALPVTLQITRNGNEYYIKGIYSQNFIPGGDIQELAEIGADFETMFNEIYSQVKHGESAQGSNTYLNNSLFAGFKGFVTGKAVINPNTGATEFDFVDAGLKVELSAGFHHSLKVWGVVFGYGILGELSTELILQKASEKGTPFKADLMLTNTLALEFYAKVGLNLNLLIWEKSVGVQGGGKGTHQQRAIFELYDSKKTQAGFATHLYAYIKLWSETRRLFWTTKEESILADWGKTFYYPNNSTNPLKPAKTKTVARIGDIYQKTAIPMTKAESGMTIIQDISSNANPQYITKGTTLVYNNLKEPTDYDDDRIQEYAAGTPSIDLNTAGSAYNFSAASFDNSAVVAYEELPISTNNGELDLSKAFSAVEVMGIIKKDGSWGTPTNLSDNNLSDLNPKTAMDSDGNAVVVWTSGILEERPNTDGSSEEESNSYINGNLKMSRYDQSSEQWSKSTSLLAVNDQNQLGHYYVSLANDGSVLIVTDRETASAENNNIPDEEVIEKEVILISVSPFPNNQTNMFSFGKGNSPRIKSWKENRFIVSYITKNELGEDDLYLTIVDKEGKPAGISGFSGLSNKIPANYRLIAKENASSLSDVSVVWSEAVVSGENNIETALFAAKLVLKDNQIYSSQPVKVLTAPEATPRIHSYDAYMADAKTLKVAAALSTDHSAAVILEKEIVYENKVSLLSKEVISQDIYPGANIDIDFTLGNDGYLPVKSVKIDFNGVEVFNDAVAMLPNHIQKIRVSYTVSDDLGYEPISYTITPTFEQDVQTRSGSGDQINGSINLNKVDLGVNLLSMNTEGSNNIVLLEVINNSPFSIKDLKGIQIGLYTDIRGEELYLGEVQTIEASKLYDDTKGEKLTTVVSFRITQPKENMTLHAIVTTAGVEDKNLMDNSIPLTIVGHKQEVNPPQTTYYTVTIPEVEGIRMDQATKVSVKKNSSLTVTISALDGYSIENLVFKANGKEITPDHTLPNGDKVYIIKTITENISVSITGVTSNTVGNAEIPEGLAVYSNSGCIIIENNLTDNKQNNLMIYDIPGALIVKQELPQGTTSIPMRKGIYMVVIGEYVFKVIV
ncbi:Ig-like domain-containing protein [Parabacteroides sp. PF5-9]|uniref:Ig-like domain-containing protein n=1 Tax=Parabacteroides sp. PF5-9 TaxID=1742404 RepID=UPI0024745D79|nr:Ig-like domain-containing protein [Parabacteroides sp. PF5-9]MDH6357558.1 hypothetical protein [Parabacteroides sp. PF5-9]